MNITPRKAKHTKGKLLTTASHHYISRNNAKNTLLRHFRVYCIINDTQVHYVEYRPHFCRLHPPPGWGCLTPITDSCRFELDELRHWARDHVGRRPDPGRSRDAIAAQVQFRNHADRALGSRDVVLQDQHQIVHFWPRWGRSPFLSLHQFRQIFSSPTSPPSRQELLTVSPSVAPLWGATFYWLPFWVIGFNCREVHVCTTGQQLKR
ncbi:hypothetical protein T09_11137 [Trichinella sp. T9]|nr:hypothetical protein T09_11137 [Trichinella sp. T9]